MAAHNMAANTNSVRTAHARRPAHTSSSKRARGGAEKIARIKVFRAGTPERFWPCSCLSVQRRIIPYMSVRVEFRWDSGLVDRVDGARGDVPRSVWVRRAVERALGEGWAVQAGGEHAADPNSVVSLSAAAEQPEPASERSFSGVDRAAAFRRATQR